MKHKLTINQMRFLKVVIQHSEATYRIADAKCGCMAPIQYKELLDLLKQVKSITIETK